MFNVTYKLRKMTPFAIFFVSIISIYQLGVLKVATYWLIILSLIYVFLPNCDE